MPVKITSVAIKNEFRTESVDWLLANVGDKVTVEIEFTVETTVLATVDNPIILQAQDGYIGAGWVVDALNRFADIKVGDQLYLYNYKTSTPYIGNPYSVLDKLSDGEIQLSNVGTLSGVAADTDSDDVLISLIKPITAVKYKYNFIENDEQPTFDSKTDGTEQVLLATGLDASDTVTVVPMEFLGAKPYQIGEAEIIGDGVATTTGYQYKFKITHITFITPFILSTQLENLTNEVAPDYFFNTKCLKGIFDIEAAYDFNDPNYIQTAEITETEGNTGWFDENFNTGLTNYEVTNVVYKRPDTSVIDGIELSLTSETTVEITIKNTIDTPFSNTNTKFTLNFCRIPYDESEYIGNTNTLPENFLFDRALQTVGSAAVNGDNFGTDYQVLKTIAATFISSSEIKITAQVDFDVNVIDVIDIMQERRYMLWVAVQQHTLATKLADKVSLLVDAREFFEDATDAGMIVADTIALRHPEDDVLTEGITLSGFSGGLEAFSLFTVTNPNNTNWAIVDQTNGDTIGLASFDTNFNTTILKLIDSLNNNVANGSTFSAFGYGVLPAFSNAAGFTAEWDGLYLKVIAPNGSGTAYNGVNISIVTQHYGYSRIAMAGGVAGISTGLTVFPEDEVVFYSQFYIDKNGRESDDIQLKRITGKIKAKNPVTLQEFTLDSFTNDLSALPFINGNQYISYELDRVYHIPSDEIRKKFQIQRRIDLDAGGLYYYDFIMPELIRWEYWKSLALANQDFFDTGEPNNGWNQFWHRYSTVTDWDLYYELEIKATKNGANLTYNFENKIDSTNYDTNADWNPNTIKSYINSDNTPLVSGGDNFILGYETTRIEAEFTKISGTPVLADVTVVIGIEVYEEGGIEGRRRLSSKWVKDSDTWLDSTTGNGKVNLSLSGNTVKAVCLVDNSLIPLDKKRFKITARLYEITPDFPSKYFQDGNDFIYQDGDTYIFQDQ